APIRSFQPGSGRSSRMVSSGSISSSSFLPEAWRFEVAPGNRGGVERGDPDTGELKPFVDPYRDLGGSESIEVKADRVGAVRDPRTVVRDDDPLVRQPD